jgi:hypothetical protein
MSYCPSICSSNGCSAFDTGRLKFFNALAILQDVRAFTRPLGGPRRTEWVVYAKEPFGGPKPVLDYLGRYTHRVAISNNCLIDIADGHIMFRWKDYRRESAQRTMRLDAPEFMRRFLLPASCFKCYRADYNVSVATDCSATGAAKPDSPNAGAC